MAESHELFGRDGISGPICHAWIRLQDVLFFTMVTMSDLAIVVL